MAPEMKLGAPTAPLKWVGRSIRRVEDPKLLTGEGNYVGDLVLPGMLHAAVLRSPFAHARIKSVDASAARALPGVVAVITGPEAAELCNPLPDAGPEPEKHPWRVLAADKVRYVGEGVAVVIAEDRYVAEDARDLIDVDYEELEPLVDPVDAIQPGRALVHEAMGSNIGYERTFRFGDVDKDFAEADLIVRDRLRWRRHGAQPLETTGAVGEYDRGSGMVTVHSNSLNFTWMAFLLANTLKIPSNKLDVRPYPAGGSFGAKFNCYRVMALAGMCAKFTGRPVKFIEDRLDNISNGDHHASDRYYDVQIAVMRDGTIKSMKTDVIDDYGAYMQSGVGTHGNSLAQSVGPYRIGSIEYSLKAVFTNKTQQGSYRGFGSEVSNWVVERMVDLAAKQLGMDPVEIRRKNFIQPEEFPYYIPGGNMYDSGNYPRVLDTALELADYDNLVKERDRLRAEGRNVGIGVVSCVERSVYSATEFWFWFDKPAVEVTSNPESVTINVDPAGNVTATLYSSPFWGNSANTMAAMLIAEELDVDPANVNIVNHGSNGSLPAAGPGGSRLTVMLAGAIQGATGKIKERAAKVAASLLEASVDDLEWVDGGYQVRGNPSARMALPEIALATYFFRTKLPDDVESGLEASHVYDHPYTTMPAADRSDLGVFYPCMGNASHIVMLEVDRETGAVTFHKYVAVHDCGTVVNPRSLEGQIVGGTAQGIGTALLEEFAYDENGQFLTTTFMDFLMPTAMEVPELVMGHEETPSPLTVHGIKGGGEAGRLMAPGAISAAIDDALSEYGVRTRELPATPQRIVRWVAEGEATAKPW